MIPVAARSRPETASADKATALPAFPRLLPGALAANGLIVGVLLVIRQNWWALGVVAGALIGVALFWSLHLISRVLVDEFLQAETDRKEAGHLGPKPQADVRRASLWRLAGMLALKYVGLAVVMIGVYHVAKSHLIPFFLAFLGAFALTQLSIVSAAARAMHSRR